MPAPVRSDRIASPALFIAACLGLAMAAAPRADAYPSFDCQKANSAAEAAVCRDDRLSKADSQLDALFRAALVRAGPARRAGLQDAQRAWLRALAGSTMCDAAVLKAPSSAYADCVAGRYAERIDVLKVMLPPAMARTLVARSQYQARLAPGGRVGFDDLELACAADRLNVLVDGDAAGARPINSLEGRGPLRAAFADCRLKSGVRVRVKAGYDSPPLPYGQCGGAPPQVLSVWSPAARWCRARPTPPPAPTSSSTG